jgi:hypothetical protein
MTHAERAREWFKRHATPHHAVPGGEVDRYSVDWSEEVEASLVGEFTEALRDAVVAANKVAKEWAGPVVYQTVHPGFSTPTVTGTLADKPNAPPD